ncbi:hypothetical protein HYPSUDRAFT_60527 [Hypholoma sublateritium FD-334 SS-4]|uniref:Glutamyl-tRNA(Gln) amidotransferase subunit B, mitochondrial n=1 Tax=Hypholoma sublateritium (strain FD-334 SS-4) TaxID=945553 RepID=A0A0D2QDL0_HYPSF|nr:hypothetical protein HYPSUDRAFT_60527 [Hypholoma sublateritium FD-334 SS-4]
MHRRRIVRSLGSPFVARLFQCRAFHDAREYKEDKRWPGWQVVVGIETHAQIKSRRKLFSHAPNAGPDDAPNTHVVPFDAAFPGTLPRLNPKCVDLGLRTALALNCSINRRSTFDRKHYFYSDLPSGYQITQQYSPLAMNGALQVDVPEAEPITVRIKQIQLEQDTAKSTFDARTQTSRIDLNRAGAGLMEIVSEPDIRSPEEAGAYVRTLQAMLRAMGASDGNMEQGSMRCDVNVSVAPVGAPLGTRCEIKNLNSIKFMMAAITHEAHRQIELLTSLTAASGSEPVQPPPSVPQETRGFDEHSFTTFRLRTKEDAPDYRYMPDPNLGVVHISEDRIAAIRETLPALPQHTRARLLTRYPSARPAGLDVLLAVDSGNAVGWDGEAGGGAVGWFEAVCSGGDGSRDAGIVLNWLTHELLGQLAERNVPFSQNTISTAQFGELIDLVSGKVITGTSGKFLLRHMLAHPSNRPTREVAEELELIALAPSNGGRMSASARLAHTPATSSASSSSPHLPTPQPTATPELHALCAAAVAALPREAAALRAGHTNVLNKLVGHVMRASRGRADALAVRAALEEIICSANS